MFCFDDNEQDNSVAWLLALASQALLIFSSPAKCTGARLVACVHTRSARLGAQSDCHCEWPVPHDGEGAGATAGACALI